MKTRKALFGILTITCGLAVCGYSQTFLTNGLVAYYPFNGNANDASGNGNGGIPLNVIFSTDRFGTPSSAVSFSGLAGTNCAVDCPSLNNLPYFPITYSCWFLLRSNLVIGVDYPAGAFNGAWMTLVGREQSDVPDYEGALLLLSREQAGWTNELTYYDRLNQPHQGAFSPSTNTWYQTVFTIDASGVLSLYVNGALVGTSSESLTALSGRRPLPFRIGASTYYLSHPNAIAPRYSWRGSIDDVRIYNRALSFPEVQQLYTYESGPRVKFVKAFTVDYANLTVGLNYQLQASADMTTWTNWGSQFTATSVNYTNTDYQRIDNWNSLYFRLKMVP